MTGPLHPASNRLNREEQQEHTAESDLNISHMTADVTADAMAVSRLDSYSSHGYTATASGVAVNPLFFNRNLYPK